MSIEGAVVIESDLHLGNRSGKSSSVEAEGRGSTVQYLQIHSRPDPRARPVGPQGFWSLDVRIITTGHCRSIRSSGNCSGKSYRRPSRPALNRSLHTYTGKVSWNLQWNNYLPLRECSAQLSAGCGFIEQLPEDQKYKSNNIEVIFLRRWASGPGNFRLACSNWCLHGSGFYYSNYAL